MRRGMAAAVWTSTTQRLLAAAISAFAITAQAQAQDPTAVARDLQAQHQTIVIRERRLADEREQRLLQAHGEEISRLETALASARGRGAGARAEVAELESRLAREEQARDALLAEIAQRDALLRLEGATIREVVLRMTAGASAEKLAALQRFADGDRAGAWPTIERLARAEGGIALRDAAVLRQIMRDAGEATSEQATALWDEAAREAPLDFTAQLSRTGSLANAGRLDEAEAAAAQALAAAQTPAQRWRARFAAMEIVQRRNEPAAGVQAITATIEALRAVPETEIPANWRDWYLADLLFRLGVTQLQAGAIDDSWATAHERADLLYAMAEREPGAGFLQNAAVTALMQLGSGEAGRQRNAAALAAFRRATVLLEQGEASAGRSAERDALLDTAWAFVCNAQVFTTGAASALQACERAVEMKRRMPRSLAADANLAQGLGAIADTRANVGDLDGAIAARREADDLWRSVSAQNPSDGVLRAARARNFAELARFPQSGVTWSAAATLWSDLTAATLLSPIDVAARDEANARAQQERGLPESLRAEWREMLLHWNLGERRAHQDDVAGAGQAFRQALTLATRLSESQPRNRQRQVDEVWLKSVIANLPDAEFSFDDVAHEWERFDRAYGPLLPPEAALYQSLLGMADAEETVPQAIRPEWRRMWLAITWSNQRFGLNDMAGAIAARRRALDLSLAMMAQAPSRDRHIELVMTQNALASAPDGGVSWAEVAATWREIEQRWGELAPQEREWLSDAERRATAGAP